MMFRKETESPVPARKNLMLIAIVLLAAGLRSWHLDFGLPALNDPDEPIFIMTALDMLREGRLNPGWFGHPATLLFYLLAMVIVAVAGIGTAVGAWADGPGFVATVFADPGVVVLPMRAVMAALGVTSVYLTYRLGKSIAGPSTGLIAALMLAVNPLHVELSQVIRTDMLATVLMNWALLHALAIGRGGGTRDHIVTGVAAGLACATKWPAILILVAPLSAAIARKAPLRTLPIAPLVAIATLAFASPYLILDWHTVLRDLGGEARPIHLGATGHGLWGNLWWYVTHPLARSITWPGIAVAALGAATLRRDAAITLLPFTATFLLALATQSLVWERWFVPLLPVVALIMARGVETVAARSRPAAAILAITVALWSTQAAIQRLTDRADDPRQRATTWLLRHAPRGDTILVESAAFDLLPYEGRLLFPLGTDGCVDIRALLASRPSHKATNEKRAGKAIVDLGHVDPLRLATCKADYYVLSNYDRYRRAGAAYARERAIYRHVLANTRRVAMFVPRRSRAPDERHIIEIYANVATRRPPQLRRHAISGSGCGT